MTTKMILIPIDRLKALEKISTDTPAKMPADVEFKLLQQNKNVRPRVREPEQKKEISMDSTLHHMQETQRARIKRTLDHMAEHDGNIKYDKYTGEIHYDGVNAPDSDVRELLSTLTSKKKRITAPKGPDSTTTSDLRRTYVAYRWLNTGKVVRCLQRLSNQGPLSYIGAPSRGADGIRVHHLVKLISTTFFVSIHTCLMDNIFITFLHVLYL